jgi:ketosteroid isomerase-like protein
MPVPTTALVERYLALIANPASQPEDVGTLLHPEVLFVEHPNMFSPAGSRRDRAAILESMVRGREVIAAQRFDVHDHHAVDDLRLVTRATWHGQTARDLGPLPVGTRFRAETAMFFEFRDGLIYRQENFDCFAMPEPPETAEA